MILKYEKKDILAKIHSAVLLSLTYEVLHEVVDKTITVGL